MTAKFGLSSFLDQNALNNHLCDSHYGPRLAKDVPYTNQSPYKCPKCNYEAKTHQMTVRHYGVKHGLLRQYMIANGYMARDPTPPPLPHQHQCDLHHPIPKWTWIGHWWIILDSHLHLFKFLTGLVKPIILLIADFPAIIVLSMDLQINLG